MSEELEKVARLTEIPIFPLPLVLLPKEVLPLHIFEPKYRQMLVDIESHGSIFGVNYFDPEQHFDRPNPGAIGCAAEVRETTTLTDGRSNILTAGILRYRIAEYVDVGTPYLTAEVEYFEDEPDESDELTELGESVYDLFERIAMAAFRMTQSRAKFPEVPRTDPESLSFLITAAFNLDYNIKYEFMEMTSTSERLGRLKGILDQAVVQIEESADIHSLSRTNGHSRKKLDL